MSLPFPVLIQTLAIPVLGGVLILVVPSRTGRHAGVIAITSLVYTTILLGLTAYGIHPEGMVLERYGLGPEVSLDLLADGLSLPIALVVNIICTALAVYSVSYVKHRIEKIYPDAGTDIRARYLKRFFFLYLFFPVGFMGVAFSTNLLSIYIFLELLTIIPLYFIMAQFGYSDFISRYRVALICLFWGVAGATLFLIGILLGYSEIHSFEISHIPHLSGNPMAYGVIVLTLLGLFTKLAMVPLHVWMPWVHAEHPTCIAGLLAVYANIAVYIMVRVLVLPLPEEMSVFTWPLMGLALVTMVYGACLTLAQTDIKRFCACSTISQISYSVFGVGAMTALGIQGGIFYFLSHILGKAVLFSTAGMVVYVTGQRDMTKMGGLSGQLPTQMVLWMMAAMILSALPPTSGFVGKWLFFSGAFQRASSHPAGIIMIVIAVLSTLLTLVYTFGAGFRIFFGQSAGGTGRIKKAPLSMALPVLMLALLSLILGIYPEPVLTLLASVIQLGS